MHDDAVDGEQTMNLLLSMSILIIHTFHVEELMGSRYKDGDGELKRQVKRNLGLVLALAVFELSDIRGGCADGIDQRWKTTNADCVAKTRKIDEGFSSAVIIIQILFLL